MIALITITLLSTAVAVVMSVLAWRLAREERLRSEARVQALAADIREIGGDEIASPVAVQSLFTAEMRAETSTPFRALAIGAVIVGAALSAIVVIAGRPGEHPGARTATVKAEPQSPTDPPPLELTSLEHEAESDGFVIRGTVVDRNPSPSNLPLTAVVFASNSDGIVVGSGRAPLEIASSSASSGVESSFVVSITGVGEIRRYRVSFRRGDRTIAHVDRRDRLVTAQLP
jgi:hypothetical protein